MSIKQIIKRGLKYIFKGVPNNVIEVKISYLSPDARLADKKIIVTGGSRGLGFAMATRFIKEGAKVLITGRNEETLKEAADQIGCHYLVYDVSDFENMDRFMIEADRLIGGANVLVNNAGISLHEGNIRNVKFDQFDRQIDINLKGAYFLSQKFLALYESKRRKHGSILFLSSERGEHVDDLPYGLIKAAINSLTRGLAKMLIRNDIRINAVAPGITATNMTGRSVDNLYEEGYATGRSYLPEEVAEIACFLISDAAGCLSGQVLVCNNGKSINYRVK